MILSSMFRRLTSPSVQYLSGVLRGRQKYKLSASSNLPFEFIMVYNVPTGYLTAQYSPDTGVGVSIEFAARYPQATLAARPESRERRGKPRGMPPQSFKLLSTLILGTTKV